MPVAAHLHPILVALLRHAPRRPDIAVATHAMLGLSVRLWKTGFNYSTLFPSFSKPNHLTLTFTTLQPRTRPPEGYASHRRSHVALGIGLWCSGLLGFGELIFTKISSLRCGPHAQSQPCYPSWVEEAFLSLGVFSSVSFPPPPAPSPPSGGVGSAHSRSVLLSACMNGSLPQFHAAPDGSVPARPERRMLPE